MEGFQDLQWYDFVSLATAFLSATALAMTGRLVYLRHSGYSARLKDIIWVLCSYSTLSVAFSIGYVVQNSPFTGVIVLAFLISLLAVRASRLSNEPLQKL